MVFLPKDDKMKNLMERLVRDRATETSFEMAKQLSRHKQIREMRRQEHLFIGMDRRTGKSVIFAKKPIVKKGKGFLL